MKKTILILLILITSLLLLGCTQNTTIESTDGLDYSISEYYNENNILNTPYEEISDLELAALEETIMDEYKAYNTYTKIILDFGEVRPFSNIVFSEQQHINELKAIYEKYNLEVPKNPNLEVVDFASISDACKAAEQAEIDNVAIYDKLFSQVDNQDILVVFTALRDASLEKHLPAFQRCGGRN